MNLVLKNKPILGQTMDSLTEFLENSTIHGLCYISRSRYTRSNIKTSTSVKRHVIEYQIDQINQICHVRVTRPNMPNMHIWVHIWAPQLWSSGGVPEKILQNAGQTRRSQVNRTLQSKVMTKSNFWPISPL